MTSNLLIEVVSAHKKLDETFSADDAYSLRSILLILFTGLVTLAEAKEVPAMADYKAKNEVRIGASFSNLLFLQNFEGTVLPQSMNGVNTSTPMQAAGLSLYWGYIVSAYVVFGVNMAYRVAPGYNSYQQFIAGLQSRIYVTRDISWILRPFVTYGFQAISTFLTLPDAPQLAGSAQHRSIHLGLGTDIFNDFYVEIVYVYSRASAFGVLPRINWDHVSIDLGYRFVY